MKTIRLFFFNLLIYLLFLSSSSHQLVAQKNSPIELGKVHWHRDLSVARDEAIEEEKDILLVFQEVPGCGTCKRFGSQVLSSPLLVELIEDYFVPVLIYNNKSGYDRAILDDFAEPAWNNPVMRILPTTASKGAESRRLSGQYTPYEVAFFLLASLEQKPAYTSLLLAELKAQVHAPEVLVAQMYCFWSGESKIGQQPGVVKTEPGFSNGREVVKIWFDPSVQTVSELRSGILASGAANRFVPASDFRSDDEPQYYLWQTPYLQFLPLLDIQRTKLNTALAAGAISSIADILSPRQQHLLSMMKADSALHKKMQNATPEQRWDAILRQ